MHDTTDCSDSSSVALLWGHTGSNSQAYQITFDEKKMCESAEDIVMVANTVQDLVNEVQRRHPINIPGCQSVFVPHTIGQARNVYGHRSSHFGYYWRQEKIPEHLIYESTWPSGVHRPSSWNNGAILAFDYPVFTSNNEEILKQAIKALPDGIETLRITDPDVAKRAGFHVLSNRDQYDFPVCTPNLRGLRAKTTRRFKKCQAFISTNVVHRNYFFTQLIPEFHRACATYNELWRTTLNKRHHRPILDKFKEAPPYIGPNVLDVITMESIDEALSRDNSVPYLLRTAYGIYAERDFARFRDWLEATAEPPNRLQWKLLVLNPEFLQSIRDLLRKSAPLVYFMTSGGTVDRRMYRWYLQALRTFRVPFPTSAFTERKLPNDLAEQLFARVEPELAEFRRTDKRAGERKPRRRRSKDHDRQRAGSAS